MEKLFDGKFQCDIGLQSVKVGRFNWLIRGVMLGELTTTKQISFDSPPT